MRTIGLYEKLLNQSESKRPIGVSKVPYALTFVDAYEARTKQNVGQLSSDVLYVCPGFVQGEGGQVSLTLKRSIVADGVEKKLTWSSSNMKPGLKVKGNVSSVQAYGAFIDIDDSDVSLDVPVLTSGLDNRQDCGASYSRKTTRVLLDTAKLTPDHASFRLVYSMRDSILAKAHMVIFR